MLFYQLFYFSFNIVILSHLFQYLIDFFNYDLLIYILDFTVYMHYYVIVFKYYLYAYSKVQDVYPLRDWTIKLLLLLLLMHSTSQKMR